MIYAQVNDEGLKLLEKELKATNGVKWYKRLKIIQFSSQGETVPQLAKRFDVCEATVRAYINRYNKGGLETLKADKSSGRPPITQLTRAEWEELLHQSPCQFVKLNTVSRNWTQDMLSVYCYQYVGVKISASAICMLLKRMGISWNRGKLKVTSPDPQYTVKRERVETLKKKLVKGH